jgi:hypothetical protein
MRVKGCRSAHYTPVPAWFAIAAKDDLSPNTAGVWSWSAGGPFGRIGVAENITISVVHAHVDVAHAGVASLDLELWRNRGQGFGPGSSPGTKTRIATVSVGTSENDGATINFTFTSDAAKVLLAGDYIHLQAVNTKPGGSGWHTFIDVHFEELTL